MTSDNSDTRKAITALADIERRMHDGAKAITVETADLRAIDGYTQCLVIDNESLILRNASLTAERDALAAQVATAIDILQELKNWSWEGAYDAFKFYEAKEAGKAFLANTNEASVENISRLIAKAKADERKACAELAIAAPYKRGGMICACSDGLADFTASAIRARGADHE